MALPILATIGLLVGLGYWNDWMNGLYYINDDRMYSIQVLLMNIQKNLDSLRQQAQAGGNVNAANLPSTAVRMALDGHGNSSGHDHLSVYTEVLCEGYRNRSGEGLMKR